jgi:hypothetical protein
MALSAHIHRMWTFAKLAKWQVVQDILRIINAEYVSPVAREEHRQKQAQKGGKWAYRDRLRKDWSACNRLVPLRARK